MSIDVSPETERLVREEPRSGHFQSVDDLIIFGVRAWHERNRQTGIADESGGGKHTALMFVEWARSHRETPPLSDEAVSRASLNPDRW
jgi:Arc/MetJ-type ribon-helix-helix transcriptional regulator